MKTADEIRSAFLKYFEDRGHRVVTSSPLVPGERPHPALRQRRDEPVQGRLPGQGEARLHAAPPPPRSACAPAASTTTSRTSASPPATTPSSRCSGNFSFGDYFKKDAIAFAWEFLTRDLGLAQGPAQGHDLQGRGRLPARRRGPRLWTAHVSRPTASSSSAPRTTSGPWATPGPAAPAPRSTSSRATRLPCAEEAAGRTCLGVECECDRWLEIWNLVFMQYDRDARGHA